MSLTRLPAASSEDSANPPTNQPGRSPDAHQPPPQQHFLRLNLAESRDFSLPPGQAAVFPASRPLASSSPSGITPRASPLTNQVPSEDSFRYIKAPRPQNSIPAHTL